MEIVLNGEKKIIDEGTTIVEFIKAEGVRSLNMVTVQLNGEFLRESDFESTQINQNDEINFLFFMGGGQ